MSDNFQYIDVDDEQFEDAPRALRQAYAALKKRDQQRDAELTKLRGTVQTNTATDVLKGKGYDPRAAKFLLQSGVDINDETAVDAWLAEDGAFFKTGEAPATPEQQVDHSDEQQARSAIQDATSQVQPAGGDKMKLALAEITDDMTPSQVQAVYQKHGI